jgi:hypothetical protein
MQQIDHRRSWTVELVHPPGVLVVREAARLLTASEAQKLMTLGLSRIPTHGPWDGSQDLTGDALTQEAAAEHQENMKIHRWVLFCCPKESLAHKMSEELAMVDGIYSIPWAANVIGDVTSVFHRVKAAIDAAKNK